MVLAAFRDRSRLRCGRVGELQAHVLSINPFDIEATADAIYEGLTISSVDRKKRNEAARNIVRTNDIARWITRQAQDIRDLVATPACGPAEYFG